MNRGLYIPPSERGAIMLRRHKLDAVLCKNLGGGVPGTATGRFQILNPSSRLRCGVKVGFRVQDGHSQSVTFDSQPTWSAAGTYKDILGRWVTPGQNLFTAANLPDSYELDSSLERFDATCTLASATQYTGDWIAIVTWEPNTPIPDDELRRLFAACGISAPADVPSIA